MSSIALDTGTPELLATLDEGVLTLTFNRPEARNALSRNVNEALQVQLAQAESNPAVKCIVLTGNGRAFCAGGDVKNMLTRNYNEPGSHTLDEYIHRQRLEQRAISGRLFTMPKPTLAAIPGAAAGAGFSIALACDLRIMADSAFMTTAFAKVGFSGDYGGSYFLTRLVGAAKAREMYLLPERIDAAQALSLGLTNWVCPAEELTQRTQALARRLASGPTVAYRYMKENLNRAISGELMECMDLEATHHVHCAQTEDHKEATRAFVDKREPIFKGR
jgi:2-(1,2-epoxy-1,2-dihydrophenyl)acetyl-CoA isomerase